MPRQNDEEDDTIEECKKCGRRIHLRFANGLRNGWDICCGQTMTIVKYPKSSKAIGEAVKECIDSQIPHSKKSE